jgi:hypothetical protein
MRYLLKRNHFLVEKTLNPNNINLQKDFKTSALINETFENDITWGASLIGRLVNSTIRVLGIYVKTVRVNFLIPRLKQALDDLIAVSRLDETQQGQLQKITSQFLLEEIIKVVNSSDSVEKKVATLLGADNNTNPGLVRSTITMIEKIENFDEKDEVIKKLEAFLEALRAMKEEIGDLPEDDVDEDEDNEDEDKDEDKNKKDETTEGGKSPATIVRMNLFVMFRSIRIVFDTLKLKKVSLEGENKKPITPEVGKEYTYTDKSGKKVQVKVIDIKNQRQPGKDGEFLTKDDVVDPKKKIVPKILVAQKNNKGVYGAGSIINIIDPKTLSESLVNEELVGTGRGRGEAADSAIKPGDPKKVIPGDPKSLKEYEKGENRASAAFKKVRGTFESNEELLKEGLSAMTQIQNDVKSDENVKGYLISIMKEVIANESTVGKPMTFKELTFDKIMDSYSIKEAVSVLKTKYAPIVKSISVVARVLLAFKEDKGLLGALGELKKPILDFIEAYDIAKENVAKIGEKKEEPKEDKAKESEKKGGQDKPQAQRESFRLFEADTPTDDDEMGNVDPPEDDEETGDDEAGGNDRVKDAWREQFTEEEEGKYKVDQKEAKSLQDAADEDSTVVLDIKNAQIYDRILEVVKIFGKAYKMYAVDYIPSGRPEGRISLKTFREYEFIGKDDSSIPEWSANENPGYGPWAARRTYEQWQDGVMNILQDTKYRKIFANSKFKNVGPNQEEGSGLTLFTFVNDMLNEGGAYSTFRQRRHALLNKYFGEGQGIEDKAGDADPDEIPKIAKEDLGKAGELSFLLSGTYGKRGFSYKDFKGGEKVNYLSTFFKVDVKSNSLKGNKSLIIFINAQPKASDVGNKYVLLVKFHINEPNKIKQSLITSYLSEELTGDDAKTLEESISKGNVPNEIVYVGTIEFKKEDDRIFEIGKSFKIKFVKSESINSDNPVEIDVQVSKVSILGSTDAKTRKAVAAKRGAKYDRPSGDKVVGITSKFKNDRIKNNFGLVKK